MERKMRKSPKRITFTLTEELHLAIKRRALNKGVTIRQYALRAIIRAMASEPSEDHDE